MTQDEIIRMAREAGFALLCSEKVRTRIERFAALVAAHERESLMNKIKPTLDEIKMEAEAIIARGEK